ncbi:MAG: winged helix DNA-binding domain-containing protein [Methanobacteriota archaeon]|nr:MAG: winged helix DNA-binding domain-containing protein [Euryarchaeota archaeon]
MKAAPESRHAPEVTADQVAAFRLARHHLTFPAPRSSLARVAGDMGGAQAQIMSAGALSLRARVRGLRPEDVEKALWQDRTLAKIWCMRGTVHLVPSDDLAVFARGSTGRANRDTAWLEGHGYSAKMIGRALDALRPALDRPRTRKELADVIAKTLGVSAHRKSGRGWGAPTTAPGIMLEGKSLPLGYLVFLACYRGIACAGPPQGNEATFVRPDVWLKKWRDLPVEEAETELLRRYLCGYGPATVKDFFAWARMTLTAARAIWARLVGELAPVRVEGEAAWLLRKDLTALRRADAKRPNVRLLPYFDSFLMGHDARGHLIDSKHYKRVYLPAGWIAPVVLVDGRVAGVWSYARKGGTLRIEAAAFHPLPTSVREAVEAEAADVARFFDSKHELKIK